MDAPSQQNQGAENTSNTPITPPAEKVSVDTTPNNTPPPPTQPPTTKQQDYINSLYSEIDTTYGQQQRSERTWLTQKQQGPLKALRTYQGDIEANISKDNTSLTKMVVMEQEKKLQPTSQSTIFNIGTPHTTQHSEKGKKIFFISLGTLLIILGAVSLSSFYFVQKKQEIAIEEQRGALVSFHRKVTVPIGTNRSVLISAIDTEKKAKNTFNLLVYIDLVTAATSSTTEKTADVSEVIPLIGPNMPPSLKRSFVGSYMLGIYPFDLNHPFLILKTKDFTSSYAGMLKWEPFMVTDIKSLFGITAATNNMFEDEIYQNKDLRVLRDEKGAVVLLYSFIDRETLIITTNELLFSTLLGKYNVTQRIQ